MSFKKILILMMSFLLLGIPSLVHIFGLGYSSIYIALISCIILIILLSHNYNNNIGNITLDLKLNNVIETIFYTIFCFIIVFQGLKENDYLSEKFVFTVINILVIFLVMKMARTTITLYFSFFLLTLYFVSIIYVFIFLYETASSGSLTYIMQSYRLTLFDNPIFTSRIMGFIIVLAIFYIFIIKKFRIVNSMIFIISLLILGSSGSRQTIIALLLSVLFLLFYNNKSILLNGKIKKRNIYKVVIFLFTFPVFFLIIVNFFRKLFSNLYIFQRLSSQGLDSTGRIEIYNQTINIIMSDVGNFLFGIGYNNFQDYSLFAYPHNLILEIWVELGFLFLLLFLIYLISTIVLFIKNRSFIDSNNFAIVLTLFIYFFSLSMFSSALYGNNMVFVFLIIMNLLSAGYKRNNLCI